MKFAAVIFPEATTVAVPTLPVTVAAFATSVATDTLPVTVAEFKVALPDVINVAADTFPATVRALAVKLATDVSPLFTIVVPSVATIILVPCCIPTAVPPAVFRKVLKEPVVFSRMKYVFSCAGITTVTFAVNVPAISSVAFLD